jgi:hypothetical protein
MSYRNDFEVLPVNPELDRVDASLPDPYCHECGHRIEAHDVVANRYCAATRGAPSKRGCICRGDLVDVGQNPTSAHRFP